jgi:hypothetical protein
MLETFQTEADAQARLAELQRRYPLPAADSSVSEVFVQRVVVGTLELFMAGLIANSAGAASVTGAAADRLGFPIDRAYFELLERMSIVGARAAAPALTVRDRTGNPRGEQSVSRVFPRDTSPGVLRSSLSNGVALHGSWKQACDAALCELVERDRLLRSFAGEVLPKRLASVEPHLASALQPHYELEAYTFDPRRTDLRHRSAGVFFQPREAGAPLVFGFAAAHDLDAALAGATREALQRLAFLWGEALPEAPPTAAPTPDFHQEFYLYPPHHAVLRAWLAGRRRKHAGLARCGFDGERTLFVDLTPPALRASGLAVAKASSAKAHALRFGGSSGRALRSRPHPIA